MFELLTSAQVEFWILEAPDGQPRLGQELSKKEREYSNFLVMQDGQAVLV